MKESRFVYRVLIIFLLILLILFLWGFIPRYIHNKQLDAAADDHPLPQVPVMEVVPNTKPIELILPSSAAGWHMTPIWSRVNGYLLRYLVDIGDRVKTGQLLAEIDTPETDQELAQAQADLVNSIAVRDIAKITADRWQNLWDKNKEAVAKQEVDQYNANFQAAEALVVANQKIVSRLTYQQQFKLIYAPFDGVITFRNVDIGTLIYGSINGTPEELFQIAQSEIIRFYVDVPQPYFRQIQNGLQTEMTVEEFPGKVFKAKVARFAKALDPTARTMQTEVDVENKDGLLYPGVFGKVKFLMYPETINFIVPTTAVIIRDSFPHVAVVDDHNIVHMKRISIGRDYGNRMEITTGLQEHDKIVTIPSDAVVEGAKVDIIQQPSVGHNFD